MDVTILKPMSSQTIQVAWLEVNTPVGNFVIQPGHAPMIVTLAQHKDITFCLKSGKVESLSLVGGVLEVDRNSARILVSE